jgi:AraC family transcriptional regulator, regulatory protein of adaptative response / methylated-DNA-[protein]-cysteine methyltransferase
MSQKTDAIVGMVYDDDLRWVAIEQRDRVFDGQFFYAVRTTGVYCRPSCAARLPRRENVTFHATICEAEGAGFRPCRRCRPHQLAQTASKQRRANDERRKQPDPSAS